MHWAVLGLESQCLEIKKYVSSTDGIIQSFECLLSTKPCIESTSRQNDYFSYARKRYFYPSFENTLLPSERFLLHYRSIPTPIITVVTAYSPGDQWFFVPALFRSSLYGTILVLYISILSFISSIKRSIRFVCVKSLLLWLEAVFH